MFPFATLLSDAQPCEFNGALVLWIETNSQPGQLPPNWARWRRLSWRRSRSPG